MASGVFFDAEVFPQPFGEACAHPSSAPVISISSDQQAISIPDLGIHLGKLDRLDFDPFWGCFMAPICQVYKGDGLSLEKNHREILWNSSID